MKALPRISATIDNSATGAATVGFIPSSPSSTTGPIRPVRVSVPDVNDPHTLALHLTRMQQSLTEVTQASRSHPMQAPMTFTNVACGTGGAKVHIAHNLNKPANWIVVGWAGNGTTGAVRLVSDELDPANRLGDANNLYLRSYVAGTAAIMVF